MKATGILIVGGLLGGAVETFAEAPPSPPPAPAVVQPAPVPTKTTKSPLIQRRGKRGEQKETEGTEALERFQADTILKSPYSVDGQPLEVDPD